MSDRFVGLVAAAAEIKRSAPVLYQAFLSGMTVVLEGARRDFEASPTDQLSRQQGYVQALALIVKKLEDCTALEAQYRQRK